MSKFILGQPEQRSEYQEGARTLHHGTGQISLCNSLEAISQTERIVVGFEKMVPIVEGRLVDIRKIRRKMRHVKSTRHGRIDFAVFSCPMSLWHKSDLLNPLSPRLSIQDSLDGVIDRHASARKRAYDIPRYVFGDVIGDSSAPFLDEALVDLETARKSA